MAANAHITLHTKYINFKTCQPVARTEAGNGLSVLCRAIDVRGPGLEALSD